MEARWSDDGVPQFSDAEKKGLVDFFAAYESAYDQINIDLMKLVDRMPAMAEVVRKTPPAQMAQQQKHSHAVLRDAVVNGNWAAFIELQRTTGATYANLNVPFRDWFDLVGAFQHALVPLIARSHASDPERMSTALVAMSRYLDVAMSVIADSYLQSKEQRIQLQQQAIQELSTPVLQVRDRMLLLPIIGVLDTHRARLLTEQLLRAIRTHRARVVVMDITGVAAVDSKVANHLLQTVEAARLMGARVVITGLSPEVATTLVTLGVDLSRLDTVADLQGGLEDAERRLGLKTVRLDDLAILKAAGLRAGAASGRDGSGFYNDDDGA